MYLEVPHRFGRTRVGGLPSSQEATMMECTGEGAIQANKVADHRWQKGGGGGKLGKLGRIQKGKDRSEKYGRSC